MSFEATFRIQTITAEYFILKTLFSQQFWRFQALAPVRSGEDLLMRAITAQAHGRETM